MIPEDRLTAYALHEVDDAERVEIEQFLAADAAARESVAATRALAATLTASLRHAEVGTDLPVCPTPAARKRVWHGAYAALAASVLIIAGVCAYAAMSQPQSRDQAANADQLMIETKTAASEETAAVVLQKNKWSIKLIDARKATESKADVKATYNRPAAPMLSNIPNVAGLYVDPKGIDIVTLGRTRPAMRGPLPLDDVGKPNPGEQAHSFREMSTTLSNPNAIGLVPERIAGYDRFPALEENAFVKVEGQAALSTFGVDVDTASYSLMRKFLSQNQMPPPGAVRLEEMVNYFPYRDAPPSGDDPFAVTVEMAECPWQPKHRLVRIGLKAKPIAFNNRPASNLVFLIDVSGSMNEPNKLPLVKQSLKLLIGELTENDRVAMVVYAGASGLVLESTSAASKSKILDALDRLEAGGSTNGASGINLAYETAVANFIPGGTNRVILCTDGDWNVGTTSTDALIKLIEEKRTTNVFLSIFGFGMGNLRDEMMVNLAGKGNGNYGYIDSIKEAHKALVEQIGGTLVTVAKDVKVQVEFNPAKVGAYRLLGYEKRKLAAQDFADDKKDAGEMGAGHVVTALYEITPSGTAAPLAGKVDELRYQAVPAPKPPSNEAFVVKLRHKLPASEVSTLREVPIMDAVKPYGEASEDFRFAAAVASYAMLLRDSPHKGNATYAAVIELAGAAKSWDFGGYRAEFVELAKKAKTLSGKP